MFPFFQLKSLGDALFGRRQPLPRRFPDEEIVVRFADPIPEPRSLIERVRAESEKTSMK